MPSEDREDLVGTHLNGRYRIDAVLGRGSMGEVYRARDTALGRDVAVKVVSHHSLGTSGRTRLLHEAQYIAKLNHPNIVTVHDVGHEDGLPFIVMEFVEGQTLHQSRPRDLETIIAVAGDISAALQHAHSQGIIHRDIKPENVLLDPSGRAKLMDFGIAFTGASRLTEEGTLLGTVLYISPEQALGRPIDQRADLYSLGVLLYEMVCGRLPFDADDPVALISQHLHAPVVPPDHVNPEIPSSLSDLIVKLLAKSPEARFESAEAVRDGLQAVSASLDSRPAEMAVEREPPETTSSGLALLDRMVRGRLVGREAELAELRGFYDRAAHGEGHLVLLSGEPGVGKTRLARELTVYARLRGAQCLVGGFQPEMDSTYLGIREALRDYLRSQPPEELRLAIGPSAPELIKLLPEVGEIVGEVTPNPHIDLFEEERIRLFDNVTQFLLRIAEKTPILFVLEDLHWADSPSLQFLHFLLRNTLQAPLLVLGTYREVSLDPARPFYETLLGLNRERLYTRLALRRLDAASVEAMLQVLLDGHVDDELVEQIYRETQGNPFFVEEVIKSLLERSALRLEAGVWTSVEGLDLQVPQSIQIAIGKRIARLPEDAQDFLRYASVLGHSFNVEVILEISGWDEERLLDALEAAEEAQFIREAGEGGQDDYIFEHTLTPQVLLEGISPRRRARFHQRAGEAIERVHANKLEDVVETLAYHFARASNRAAEKAVSFGLQAAQKAISVYAHEQANRFYADVLEVLEDLGDPEREAMVWELMGDTKEKLNYSPETAEAFENALAALEEADVTESEKFCRVSFKLADSLATDDPTRAKELLEENLSNPALPAISPLRAKCMTTHVYLMLQDQAIGEAQRLARDALDVAEESGDQKAIAGAWRALARVHSARDDLPAYFDAAERQISALEACDDYFGIFGSFYDGLEFCFLKGDIPRAERLATNGLDFCQKTKAPGWEGTILASYLWILWLQGRWSEALRHADRVLPLFKQIGRSTCLLYVLLDLVMIEGSMGSEEQAEKHMDNMLNLLLQFDDIDGDSNTFLLWRFLGLAFLGRWNEAWELVEDARARDYHPRSVIIGSGYMWTVMTPEVAARAGRYMEAESMARDTLSYFEEADVSTGIAAAQFALGLGLAGQERWQEALHEYEGALVHFRELTQVWDIAKTQYEIARVYAARGGEGDLEEARENFEQALATFEEIQARPYVDKTRTRLGVLASG